MSTTAAPVKPKRLCKVSKTKGYFRFFFAAFFLYLDLSLYTVVM